MLIVFNIRRYDARMVDFAASTREPNAQIVLITDQWMSSIARIAVHTVPDRIETPSSWYSNIVLLSVAGVLIAATVNARWPETQARIRELESLAGRRPR